MRGRFLIKISTILIVERSLFNSNASSASRSYGSLISGYYFWYRMHRGKGKEHVPIKNYSTGQAKPASFIVAERLVEIVQFLRDHL